MKKFFFICLVINVVFGAPCVEIREETLEKPDNGLGGLLLFCLVMSCISSVIFSIAGVSWCVMRWRNFRRAYAAFGAVAECPPLVGNGVQPPAVPIGNVPVAIETVPVGENIRDGNGGVVPREKRVLPPR